MRKTVGAGRVSVVRRFFGESFLLVGAAAVLALALVILLIPAFNRLSGKSFPWIFSGRGRWPSWPPSWF